MKQLRPALAVALACALPAAADCSWEWLCNGDGACKQMPVCDSVYDTPPPRPKESRPSTTPPLAMRHATSAGAARPDTTLTCEHIMRADRAGRWQWTEACFCADPARARDATPPFANIVRCESGK